MYSYTLTTKEINKLLETAHRHALVQPEVRYNLPLRVHHKGGFDLIVGYLHGGDVWRGGILDE